MKGVQPITGKKDKQEQEEFIVKTKALEVNMIDKKRRRERGRERGREGKG